MATSSLNALLWASPLAQSGEGAAQGVQTLVMTWSAAIAQRVGGIIDSPGLTALAMTIFLACAGFAFAWWAVNWFRGRAGFADLVSLVVLVLITQVLMLQYDVLTRTIYSGFDGLAGLYQQALIGTDEPMDTAFSLIQRTASTVITEEEGDWWGFGINFDLTAWMNMAVAACFAIVQALFATVVALVVVWVFLGYTIMKLIGVLFVPALVLPIGRRYFMSWLSLFLGFLTFGFLSRIVLALALIGAQTGVMDGGGAAGGTLIVMGSVWDVLALFLFYAACGYGLFRSGTIASTLTSSGFALQDPIGKAASWIGGQFK